MKIPNVKLGQKVRDKMTGFTGIATAKIEFLNGCVQIQIKPKAVKKDEMPDGVFVDVEQIEILDKKKKKTIRSKVGGYKKLPRNFREVRI